jgi:hypothetical protein
MTDVVTPLKVMKDGRSTNVTMAADVCHAGN